MPQEKQFGLKSETGKSHTANEDSVFADADMGLWLVADGMGGYKGGALASKIAVETISKSIRRGQKLISAINEAHLAISQAATNEADLAQMGTTVVALKSSKNNYEIAWVGDSRVYLWQSPRKKLEQLSQDHSYVAQLLAIGDITPEEAANHPHQHILTSCLGAVMQRGQSDQPPQVGHLNGSFKRETSIVLCSDGMSDVLSDKRIAEILQQGSSIQQQAEDLVSAAQQAGSQDDISVLIVAAPDAAPRAWPELPQWLVATFAIAIGIAFAIAVLLIIQFFLS